MSTVGSSISIGASNTTTPAISSSIVCSNESIWTVSSRYISISISGSAKVNSISRPESIIIFSTICVNVVPPISCLSNICITLSIWVSTACNSSIVVSDTAIGVCS